MLLQFCFCRFCRYALHLWTSIAIIFNRLNKMTQTARTHTQKMKWTNAINLIEKFQNEKKKHPRNSSRSCLCNGFIVAVFDWWQFFFLALSVDFIHNTTVNIMKNQFDFVFAFNLGSIPPNRKSNVYAKDERYKSIMKLIKIQSNSFGSNITKHFWISQMFIYELLFGAQRRNSNFIDCIAWKKIEDGEKWQRAPSIEKPKRIDL